MKKLSLTYSALCHRDGRERADDPFVDSLVYDSSEFMELAKVIKEQKSITSLDISHYTVQIEEDDMDFKSLLREKYLKGWII